MAALLHRDRREPGQRLRRAHGDHVAEREHLGVARQREIGLDGEAARRGRSRRPRRRRAGAASGEAVTPAAQIAVRAGILRRRAVGGADRRPSRAADADDRRVEQRRGAELAQRLRRAFARATAGTCRAGGLLASTSSTRAVACRSERKSRRSVSRASSAICPAISTPVGPPPTTTNVSHSLRELGVRLDLGRLEREQDPPAQVERALQRLQLRRVLGPLVVAEVRVARSRPRRRERRRAATVQRRSAGARGGAPARRGRTPSPRPAGRERSSGVAAPGAAARRSPPRRARRSPPGRRAAGRDGSSGGRRGSGRRPRRGGHGRPAGRRSLHRRSRRAGSPRRGIVRAEARLVRQERIAPSSWSSCSFRSSPPAYPVSDPFAPTTR